MTDELEPKQNAWKSRANFAFMVFAAIGAFLLIAEHWAHLLPYLPWVFLAACPLMHFFMHGGHGHRHDGASQSGASGINSAEAKPERPNVNSATPLREPRQRGGQP